MHITNMQKDTLLLADVLGDISNYAWRYYNIMLPICIQFRSLHKIRKCLQIYFRRF